MPQAHRAIVASGRDEASIRAEGYALHASRMPSKLEYLLTRGRVPHLDGLVPAGRRQAPAVRAERDVANILRMAPAGRELPTLRDVPDPHRSIPARRGQGLAIGGEGHMGELLPFNKGLHRGACFQIPQDDALVPTGRGHSRPVRAKNHVHDAVRVPGQDMDFVPGVSIPQADRPVVAAGGVRTGSGVGAGGDDLRAANALDYRVSWQTSLGGFGNTVVEDNLKAWSGDHCIGVRTPSRSPKKWLSPIPISSP